jgi:hypothetical protein
MEDTMASIYSPLDTKKREIRVLTIDEQTPESSLVACSLNTVSLDDQPNFTALSYCWGASEPKGDILVNGVTWRVTPNLAAALQHLRRTEDARTMPIWIDALCINQEYLEERSAQVAMMMAIYAQAKCVHIWLGNEIGPSSEAMETLGEIFAAGQTRDLATAWCQRSLECVAQKLNDMIQIGENPYWQRMWILQEVSFASWVVMHSREARVELCSVHDPNGYSGSIMMRLRLHISDVSRYIREIINSGSQITASHETANYIYRLAASAATIMDVIDRCNWNRSVGLINEANRLEGDIGAGAFDFSQTELLIIYRKMLATDPKDKIYGLLGFVMDFRGLQPDYSKSIKDVYCSATLRLMRGTADLSYLSQACSNNPDLPSWVPDYSKPCPWEMLAVVDRSGWAASSASVCFDMDTDSQLLVRGLIFDRIASVRDHGGHDNLVTNKMLLQREWTDWLSFHPLLLREATDNSGRPSTRLANLCEYILSGDNEKRRRCREWMGAIADASEPLPTEFMSEIASLIHEYELFSSEKGYFGIVPKDLVSAGDSLAIIAGARVPFCVSFESSSSRPMKIRLKAPCVLDGDVVRNGALNEHPEWAKHTALGKHVRWINADSAGMHRYPDDGSSIMAGAIAIAEALQIFHDPDRVDEVFESMAII